MKKQFLRILALASIFSISSALFSSQAPVDGVAAPLVDNSGTDRIINIMSQIKHNIVPDAAESITYVQVSNINQDLNIKEIANFFAPKTVMGNSFLVETLQRPVSSIDKSGIVQLRADIISELVKNPLFKKQIEDILQIVAQQEKVTMELLSDTFRGETCPELEELELEKKKNPIMYTMQKANLTSQTWHTTKMGLKCLQAGFLVFCSVAAAYLSNYEELCQLIHQDPKIIMGFSGLHGVLGGMESYEIYKKCSQAGKKRVKMHALNQLVHAAESIEQLSNQHKISTQFKMSLITDDKGIYLVDNLKASRYENETDYCFNVPAVDTFLYELYEDDSQLAQTYQPVELKLFHLVFS